MNYEDRLMVGYRYYDTKNIEPEFLLWIRLELHKLYLQPGQNQNERGGDRSKTSRQKFKARDGTEVVQIYLKPPHPSEERPSRIEGFQKDLLENRPVGGGHLHTQTKGFLLIRSRFAILDWPSLATLRVSGCLIFTRYPREEYCTIP